MSKYGVLSGSYFPAFGLNTERYRVSLRTQSKYWKIRTRKNSVFGRFSRSEIISYNDVVVGSLPFYSYSIFLVFFDTIYIRLALCQIHGEGGWWNHFKYFENHKSYVNEFCIVNSSKCQILIWTTKYFACFSRFLPVNRIFQKMDCTENSNPSSSSTPVLIPLFYSRVIRVKVFVLRYWVCYIKWKSLIRHEKCWMLWKAMLREMIILLPKK